MRFFKNCWRKIRKNVFSFCLFSVLFFAINIYGTKLAFKTLYILFDPTVSRVISILFLGDSYVWFSHFKEYKDYAIKIMFGPLILLDSYLDRIVSVIIFMNWFFSQGLMMDLLTFIFLCYFLWRWNGRLL